MLLYVAIRFFNYQDDSFYCIYIFVYSYYVFTHPKILKDRLDGSMDRSIACKIYMHVIVSHSACWYHHASWNSCFKHIRHMFQISVWRFQLISFVMHVVLQCSAFFPPSHGMMIESVYLIFSGLVVKVNISCVNLGNSMKYSHISYIYIIYIIKSI